MFRVRFSHFRYMTLSSQSRMQDAFGPSPSLHHPRSITLAPSPSLHHPRSITLAPSPSLHHPRSITLAPSRLLLRRCRCPHLPPSPSSLAVLPRLPPSPPHPRPPFIITFPSFHHVTLFHHVPHIHPFRLHLPSSPSALAFPYLPSLIIITTPSHLPPQFPCSSTNTLSPDDY